MAKLKSGTKLGQKMGNFGLKMCKLGLKMDKFGLKMGKFRLNMRHKVTFLDTMHCGAVSSTRGASIHKKKNKSYLNFLHAQVRTYYVIVFPKCSSSCCTEISSDCLTRGKKDMMNAARISWRRRSKVHDVYKA